MIKTQVQILALDCGGVLRFDAWEAAFAKLARERGIDPSPLIAAGEIAWRTIDAMDGVPEELEQRWAQSVLAHLPKNIELSGDELCARVRREIKWIDEANAAEMFDRAASKCKIALMTNDNRPWFNHMWDALRLERWVAPEDVFLSCALGQTKKAPSFFIQAAQALSVEPRTILFADDREENIQTASSLGYQVLYVPGNSSFGPWYLNQMLLQYGI